MNGKMTNGSHKKHAKRARPKISKAERFFLSYLKRRSASFGRVADAMERDPRPRLAGAVTLS
jgi:hypothetical protein